MLASSGAVTPRMRDLGWRGGSLYNFINPERLRLGRDRAAQLQDEADRRIALAGSGWGALGSGIIDTYQGYLAAEDRKNQLERQERLDALAAADRELAAADRELAAGDRTRSIALQDEARLAQRLGGLSAAQLQELGYRVDEKTPELQPGMVGPPHMIPDLQPDMVGPPQMTQRRVYDDTPSFGFESPLDGEIIPVLSAEDKIALKVKEAQAIADIDDPAKDLERQILEAQLITAKNPPPRNVGGFIEDWNKESKEYEQRRDAAGKPVPWTPIQWQLGVADGQPIIFNPEDGSIKGADGSPFNPAALSRADRKALGNVHLSTHISSIEQGMPSNHTKETMLESLVGNGFSAAEAVAMYDAQRQGAAMRMIDQYDHAPRLERQAALAADLRRFPNGVPWTATAPNQEQKATALAAALRDFDVRDGTIVEETVTEQGAGLEGEGVTNVVENIFGEDPDLAGATKEDQLVQAALGLAQSQWIPEARAKYDERIRDRSLPQGERAALDRLGKAIRDLEEAVERGSFTEEQMGLIRPWFSDFRSRNAARNPLESIISLKR
tara:strand:+ start:323 stop:1987 length:1665 start_codon:yes stop_codon:yes gene_type:complete